MFELSHTQKQKDDRFKYTIIDRKLQKLTAASMFAGDSSFGLESIEIMLNTILSTWKHRISISIEYKTKVFTLHRVFIGIQWERYYHNKQGMSSTRENELEIFKNNL